MANIDIIKPIDLTLHAEGTRPLRSIVHFMQILCHPAIVPAPPEKINRCMKLQTTCIGLNLNSSIIVCACTLSEQIDNIV